MKGVDVKFYNHKIKIKEDEIPIKSKRYIMNMNYTKKIQARNCQIIAKLGHSSRLDNVT